MKEVARIEAREAQHCDQADQPLLCLAFVYQPYEILGVLGCKISLWHSFLPFL